MVAPRAIFFCSICNLCLSNIICPLYDIVHTKQPIILCSMYNIGCNIMFYCNYICTL